MSEPNPYGGQSNAAWNAGQQPPTPPQPPAGAPQPPVGAPQPSNPAPGYGYPANQEYGYPAADPQYGYPQGPATPPHQAPTMAAMPSPAAAMVPAAAPGAALMAIGDITVMQDRIVTPSGEMPLRGAIWNATDMSRTEERIPPHAIVLAIVFFIFCLLGLLFLLMKERKTVGFVQVTVTSGGRHHSTMIPSHGPHTMAQVMSQLNYVRSISA